MREIGDALAAHLASGATTLCHCWRVSRRDGTVIGFTDHDRDLDFGGTTYLAASGFLPSDAESESGLAAGSSEVAGALSSDAIRDEDGAARLYDGAVVDLFKVNWQATSQHILLRRYEIGEVTRSDGQFRAELRGLAHRLQARKGRIYASRCDATLGDGRCGVDLEAGGFLGTGTIARVLSSDRIEVDGLDDFASGVFRYGRIDMTSGTNAGIRADIEAHRKEAGKVVLVLWLPLARPPQVGDTFSIAAGCDKSFETCRKRFANQDNFRGFPHMPGSDFAYSYADGDTEHDGGPLYD